MRITSATLLGLALGACGGSGLAEPPAHEDSGFNSKGPADGGDDEDIDEPGDDDDDDPGVTGELCDAGDEAWVKRAIPYLQGRRPDSIREVRMLADVIGQLDDAGMNGRRMVSYGLTQGDIYLERWKTNLYELLKVERSGDRLNTFCYAFPGQLANNGDLAAAIRDNAPTDAPVFEDFTMADVVYSSIHLDNVTPLYRADLFARMWAPVTGGNASRQELEVFNRTTFGFLYEDVYLGRTTECLQCHVTTESTTFTTNVDLNRHFSVHPDIDFEYAVYGDFQWATEVPALEDVHSIFRHAGFVDYTWCSEENGGCTAEGRAASPGIEPWGWEPSCGKFLMGNQMDDNVDLPGMPYMAGEFNAGAAANLLDLEPRLMEGFRILAEDGVEVGGESDNPLFVRPASPEAALAFLFSLNFAEHAWVEGMGYPLTVANRFPRNGAQRDILQQLAEVFYSNEYSLREVITEVAVHPYFNQAPPDTCGTSSPYHMPAIFDPFTRSATDPQERGNGVGDMLHRYPASVLLETTSQSMWWSTWERFGEQTTAAFLSALLPPQPSENAFPFPPEDFIHQLNPLDGSRLQCCGAGYCAACEDAPDNTPFLRDLGIYVNEYEGGFNGTDFNGLLHWEEELASGNDPGLIGRCNGPLGQPCANQDYIVQLVGEATGGGYTMWDVAVALKDRLITEPEIYTDIEIDAIEAIMGVGLDEDVEDVGAGEAEAAARRYAGVLLNTPQFMLDGITSRDQDPGADPALIVPGTTLQDECDYFAGLTEESAAWEGVEVSCSADGVTVTP